MIIVFLFDFLMFTLNHKINYLGSNAQIFLFSLLNYFNIHKVGEGLITSSSIVFYVDHTFCEIRLLALDLVVFFRWLDKFSLLITW